MEITAQIASELVHHEAIVLEAYKDSEGVWTWGIGVTDASGHKVAKYKDNPSDLRTALSVYVWLLNTKYAPAVRKAFLNQAITESQFAAGLSFHYNTGSILKTAWVDLFRDGKREEAEVFLRSHYLNGGDLQGRRNAEADLFFKGKWAGDGQGLILPVKKPSYQPDFRHGRKVPILPDLTAALEAQK